MDSVGTSDLDNQIDGMGFQELHHLEIPITIPLYQISNEKAVDTLRYRNVFRKFMYWSYTL